MTRHLGTLGPGHWAPRPAEGGHWAGPETLVLQIQLGLQGVLQSALGQGCLVTALQGTQQAAAKTVSHLLFGQPRKQLLDAS